MPHHARCPGARQGRASGRPLDRATISPWRPPQSRALRCFWAGTRNADPTLFGPIPGRRLGDVIAYESQAPATFTPWPGRSRVERKYALLDLGVSFGIPCWSHWHQADGTTVAIPVEQQDMWYVDLVTIERNSHGRYVLRGPVHRRDDPGGRGAQDAGLGRDCRRPGSRLDLDGPTPRRLTTLATIPGPAPAHSALPAGRLQRLSASRNPPAG